jgi:hypothetical protein
MTAELPPYAFEILSVLLFFMPISFSMIGWYFISKSQSISRKALCLPLSERVAPSRIRQSFSEDAFCYYFGSLLGF